MPSLSPLSSLGNRLEKNVRRKNLAEGGGEGGGGWLAFTLSRSLDNNLIKGKWAWNNVWLSYSAITIYGDNTVQPQF